MVLYNIVRIIKIIYNIIKFKESRENMWFKDCCILKSDRVIVKIKNIDSSFKESIVIPTVYYPLNKNEYKVFTSENTEILEDEKILDIFDDIEFNIGQCYGNSDNLTCLLKENGYDAKTYVGWLFVSEKEYPVHHAWVVVNDKYVLDLSDSYMLMAFKMSSDELENKDEQFIRKKFIDFQKSVQKMKNSERCYPVGAVTPFLFYVGTECSGKEGLFIYKDLVKKYPNHNTIKNCDINGYNKSHLLMKDIGIMK